MPGRILDESPPQREVAAVEEESLGGLNAPSKYREQGLQELRSQSQFDASGKAHDLYEAMHGGVWGIGTDEEAVFDALRGLSVEEAKELKDTYREHYGRDLEEDLQSELSGYDEQRALTSLAGSQARSDALALRDAMEGAGTDEAEILNTLRGKSPEEIAEIRREYEKNGRDLEEDLRDELGGTVKDQAIALLRGDSAACSAAVIREAIAGAGTDEDAVYRELEGKSPAEIKAIKDAYERMYDISLDEDIKGDFSEFERDRALSLSAGDGAKADAARLKEAMDGAGTVEEEIFKTFEGKSAEEREAIKRAFKDEYGENLEDALHGELSGDDLRKAFILMINGELSDAQKLYFAMSGAGTDEGVITEVLEGKSKEEIDAIRKEFREFSNGQDLDDRLKDELSGRDEFEADMALRGKAETVEEQIARLEERRDFERSGISGWIMDKVTGKGELLDGNVKRVKETYVRATEDNEISGEEKKEIERRIRYGNQDVETYQNAKQSVADTAGTVAATGVAIAVEGASGGLATPLVAGAVAYVGTKKVVEGKAYDVQGMGRDAVIGGVEGVITAATAGGAKVAEEAVVAGTKEAAGTVFKQGAKELAVEAAKQGVGGAAGMGVRTATEAETWKDGVGQGVKTVGEAVGVGFAAGSLGTVGVKATGKVSGTAAKKVFRPKLPEEGAEMASGGARRVLKGGRKRLEDAAPDDPHLRSEGPAVRSEAREAGHGGTVRIDAPSISPARKPFDGKTAQQILDEHPAPLEHMTRGEGVKVRGPETAKGGYDRVSFPVFVVT